MVQGVLRGMPNALASSASVWSPVSLAASASCLILADCRALISDGHIIRVCPSFYICRWKRRSRSLGIASAAIAASKSTAEAVLADAYPVLAKSAILNTLVKHDRNAIALG